MRRPCRKSLLLTFLGLTFVTPVRSEEPNALLCRVRAPEASVRAAAVRAVQEAQADIALAEALVEALRDRDAIVQVEAAKSLASRPEAFDAAFREERRRAGELRDGIGGPVTDRWIAWQRGVADGLTRLGRDPLTSVRRQAARSLAQLCGGVEWVFDTVPGCGNDGIYLSDLAEERLRGLAKEDPALVVWMVGDGDPTVAVNAYHSLPGQIARWKAGMARRWLGDRRPHCRAVAARSVYAIDGDPRDVAPLLGDRDERVREVAVDVLHNEPGVMNALLADYKRLRAPFRRSAMQLLGSSSRAADRAVAINWGLADRDARTRYYALIQCDREDLPLDAGYLRASLSHSDAEIRRLCVSLIGKRFGSDARPLLLRMLRDRDPEVHAAAVDFVAPAATLEELRAIVSACRRSTETDCHAAQSALGQRAEIALPLLSEMLADRDWRMRSMAAGVFRLSRVQRDPGLVRRLLADPHPGVCTRAAVDFLYEEGAEVESLLAEQAERADPRARANAVAALAAIGHEEADARLNAMCKSTDAALAAASSQAAEALRKSPRLSVRP